MARLEPAPGGPRGGATRGAIQPKPPASSDEERHRDGSPGQAGWWRL